MNEKKSLSGRRKKRRLISDDEEYESGTEDMEMVNLEENSSSKTHKTVMMYSDDEYEFKLSDEESRNKSTFKKIKNLKNGGYNEQSPSPFDQVPSELLMYLLLFLDFKDMCNVAKVCKRWKILSEQDVMWTELCQRHTFDPPANPTQSTYKTRTNYRFGKASYSMKTLFKHKHILRQDANKDVLIIETKKSNGTKKDKPENKKNPSKQTTPRKKAEKAKQPPPKPPTVDTITPETREKWRHIIANLISKPSPTTTDQAQQLAESIETETFRQNASSRNYNARIRSLHFNLSTFDALRQGLLSGKLTSVVLCDMNHEQMKHYN